MSADRPKILGRFTVSSQRAHSKWAPASCRLSRGHPGPRSTAHYIPSWFGGAAFVSFVVVNGFAGSLRLSGEDEKRARKTLLPGPTSF